LFDWLIPWIRPAASGAISLFDKVRGKGPVADFRPTSDGVVLYLSNVRHETIIIEDIEAVPRLLTFSVGKEIRDLERIPVRFEHSRHGERNCGILAG
jgi:hypothetical protein